MKKIIPICSMLACTLYFSPACADDLQTQHLEESRKTAQEFMQKLGGTLKAQLESAGPEQAAMVCKQVSPALAAEYSGQDRVVKRVSLKPRNKTLGTPDAWETQQLESFEMNLREGKPVAGMEKGTIIEGPDGRWFRYIKAIPTQLPCLQCHGQPYQISQGMKTLLAREYPDDQATGYSAGAIRGAVSIKKKLP